MAEGAELLFDGRDHLRMAVPGVDHRDSGGEINVAAAIDVPQLGILGARGEQRLGENAARNGIGTALLENG